MRILFYLIESRLSPRGGPLGVGYYYYQEMKKRDDTTIEFLKSDKIYESVHSAGRKITKYLPQWLNSLHRNFRGALHLKKFLEEEPKKTTVFLNDYDVVFFHETKDLYREKVNLESFKGVVMLQSHSPLPLWQEQTTDLPSIYFRMIPDLKKKFSKIDEYAFRRADYIVFPCKEAEEPYLDSWELYRTIHNDKQGYYRYITTGIMPATAKRRREDIRKELSIPNESFVISFVGRHNTVKGYDLLKEIGKKFLSLREDNYVIVAGKLGPIKEPDFINWIEIGWTTDPHSYINASDVFILPNRVTYFDLVLLEVMSLGKIAIVSRTGGNKFFEQAGVAGILFYDTTDQAIEQIKKIQTMTLEEREKLGAENKKFYQEHLTVSAMYDQFLEVMKGVESEKYER